MAACNNFFSIKHTYLFSNSLSTAYEAMLISCFSVSTVSHSDELVFSINVFTFPVGGIWRVSAEINVGSSMVEGSTKGLPQ